jgi:four helix bundle suffix protein
MSDLILRTQTKWENLFFYQKTVVLYQLTVVFCKRFLPKYGDRTVDQMVQAARSGKQNIVEGLADGVTSTEMTIKLLNVARASLAELREDYLDYLRAHALSPWAAKHPRYDGLLKFCRENNELAAYESLMNSATDEELANLALTLCHMTDRMMTSYLKAREADFVENGGIRERMTAARLGRRETQRQEIEKLKQLNEELKQLNEELRRENLALKKQLGLA